MESNVFQDLEMDAAMTMTVPALKGVMGGVDYYVITLPFSVASRYMAFTDKNLPPKIRENRKVSPQRFADIARYIRNNPEVIATKVKRPLNGLKVAPYYGCQLIRPDYGFDSGLSKP